MLEIFLERPGWNVRSARLVVTWLLMGDNTWSYVWKDVATWARHWWFQCIHWALQSPWCMPSHLFEILPWKGKVTSPGQHEVEGSHFVFYGVIWPLTGPTLFFWRNRMRDSAENLISSVHVWWVSVGFFLCLSHSSFLFWWLHFWVHLWSINSMRDLKAANRASVTWSKPLVIFTGGGYTTPILITE
jgi:hypothetical protein